MNDELYRYFEIINQISIFILGTSAIWLVSSKNKKTRRIGAILGLIGQPFWFISSWMNEQYGIVFLSLIYTISWIRGIKNNK